MEGKVSIKQVVRRGCFRIDFAVRSCPKELCINRFYEDNMKIWASRTKIITFKRKEPVGLNRSRCCLLEYLSPWKPQTSWYKTKTDWNSSVDLQDAHY